jgi:uncharacterized RDD family membrane protein YckC
MFFIIGGDGKEYGPVPAEQVELWITNGRANLETRAKREGTEEWKRLAEFPEFGAQIPPVLGTAAHLPPPLASTGSTATPGAAPEIAFLPASRWLRLGGAFIDGMMVCIFSIPTGMAIGRRLAEVMADGRPDPQQIAAAIGGSMYTSLPYLSVLVVIQAWLIATRGQSIGKLLVGTKIVRSKTGERADFARAFLVRSAVPTVLGRIPILGFLFWLVDVCFIFRDDSRCLHDLMADTIVVKK